MKYAAMAVAVVVALTCLADNPLDSVALGTGKCVEDFDTLRQVLVPESRR